MKKKSVMIATVLILAYYVFVSGLVFEATGSTKMDSLDTPYSIAMSNDRIGFVGIYEEGDIDCVKWMASSTPSDRPVWVDYLGMSLMIDYTGYSRGTYQKPEGEHYLLLHSWNVENQKFVFGWFEGTREYDDLPDLSDYREVFRKGNAVVYESIADVEGFVENELYGIVP